MSTLELDSEYKKQVKSPIIRVTVRKTYGSLTIEPVYFNIFYPNAIDCNISKSYDQTIATCDITMIVTKDNGGNDVIFAPMDNVIVEQGWNKTGTFIRTFYGFVDTVKLNNFPKTQILSCTDVLKLANINFYTEDNYKSYWNSSEEDDHSEYGEVVISEFLSDSGIPITNQDLDVMVISGASEGARVVIGGDATSDQPLEFKNVTALEAINNICSIAGYHIWATDDGMVRLRYVRPFASNEAALVYRRKVDVYDDSNEEFDVGAYYFDEGGNLLDYEGNTTDVTLRNWIDVKGYVFPDGDQITATVLGNSDYIPSGVDYRRAEVDNYLIDTNSMAQWYAQLVYNDLNRLRYFSKAAIEGDPRVRIGQTIEIQDGDLTAWVDASGVAYDGIKYFLYDYSSSHDVYGYKTRLGLVGGVGLDSPPFDNMSPVAIFDYSVDYEYLLASGTFIICLSAKDSYDPDGKFSDLSFEWVISGYDTASGVSTTYQITDYASSINVTLIVYDSGVPTVLSDSLTKTINLTLPTNISSNVIYVASGKKIYVALDGGETWSSTVLY